MSASTASSPTRPGKLDAGTLYAAKWTQTSAENGGAADIGWVDLGHADSAAVKALVKGGTKFSDIFATAKMAEDGSCPAGFGASVANGAKECLKVKEGMELAASRLETRRYAALAGGHGRAAQGGRHHLDPDHNRLYVAISEISNGMEDAASKGKASSKYDGGGSNDIKLAYNPCGGVYALDLDRDYVGNDHAGDRRRQAERATRTAPNGPATPATWTGSPTPTTSPICPAATRCSSARTPAAATRTTRCGRTIWPPAELTRILTTPYGAETTSVYAYPDVNGHGYVMAVVQHPYGESDAGQAAVAGPGAGLSRLYRAVPEARLSPAADATSRGRMRVRPLVLRSDGSWMMPLLRLVLIACALLLVLCCGHAAGAGPLNALVPANPFAYIPPQCWTKTRDAAGAVHNPCYTCHVAAPRAQLRARRGSAASYDFADERGPQPWTNLFVDRRPAIAGHAGRRRSWPMCAATISTTPAGNIELAGRLERVPAAWDINGDGVWSGYRPDVWFAFDDEGFDRDPSGRRTGWRAFAYKPLPGAFWPTNGSADDVAIRLPAPFRERADGRPDDGVYALNLAILESLITQADVAIPATDEVPLGVDLDRDGRLGTRHPGRLRLRSAQRRRR